MASRTINILCFGDSLTSGWTSYGMESHPYSLRFDNRLLTILPNTKCEIFTNGQPGELASSSSFQARLRVELEKRKYDWVIILGGTNDLGTCNAKDIYEALQESWNLALAKGSKVLALTVPESAHKIGWVIDRRWEVNDMILSHEAPGFHSFHLQKYIPYHSLTDDDRERYWDDHLHLTPEGYDWMGGHIAEAIVPLLKESEPVKPKTRARRSWRDDGVAFDEENGNTSDISQGYVVVRRKDLD